MKRKVQIVIISKNLEVLVFKTNKDRGSFWQNVTGSVDDEESFEDASIRELIEETGIDELIAQTSIKTLESEFYFTDRKERKVQEKVFYYYGEKWDIQMCEEHVEYKWISPSEIDLDFYKYKSNYQALLKSIETISPK